MKGNLIHIEDIYAIKYIRHNGVYILYVIKMTTNIKEK